MIRALVTAIALGVVLGACEGVDQGNDDDGTTEGPASCEHGTYSECACPDGSMGTQLCAHDTSGFEACMCGGNDDASGPDTTPATEGDSSSVGTSVDPSASADSGPADTGASTTTDASDTATQETGPVGSPPTAMINHPGTEDRQAGVAIPFIGVASDAEDGALSGMSMIWTDDVEGMIGEGETFDAALNVVGDHTVTLTATDADGNIGEATLTFAIVP